MPPRKSPTSESRPRAKQSMPAERSVGKIKVRMYRQGLGDCFLLTLPKDDSSVFYILIDCGVVLGTPDATAKMRTVVEDVITTTKGKIDLLIATHEHWDHLSGFWQARELFEKKLTVGQVWLAW